MQLLFLAKEILQYYLTFLNTDEIHRLEYKLLFTLFYHIRLQITHGVMFPSLLNIPEI